MNSYRHGMFWKPQEVAELTRAYAGATPLQQIAERLHRTIGGVEAKLKYLGLMDQFGHRIKQQ